MRLNTTPVSRRRLNTAAAAVLAAAASLAVVGCNNGTNDAMAGGSNNGGGSTASTAGKTNSTAVAAPNASNMDRGSATMFDTVQYFPHGIKDGAVLEGEAMGPKSIRLNHDASYQIKVTNLTDVAVHNVMLSSTNPDGFQVTSAAGATTQPMDKGMGFALGDFAPREVKTVTVAGMATKAGPVDTCYTATFNPPTLCTMLNVTNPAIALAVQAPADGDICRPITYTYTVNNTGSGTAHNVTVQEDLPDGLMTTDGKQSVMANVGDIPQGESRTVTAQLKAAKTGTFNGQAMAKSDGDAAPSAATATAVHAPMLAVAVTGEPSDFVGKTAPYQITVTNKGDAVAMNTKLQIGHPSGGMGTVNAEGVDGSGMVTIGDLKPGDSKTVNATATSTTGGNVTVIANAMDDCVATPVSGQAVTMFNTIPALLLETVDEADPVKVGTNVVYDVKVTNQGSGPDNNVKVTATLPDGEEYVSTDGPTQPTVDGKTLTFPVIPSLGTKESATWKVSVKAVTAQDVQFKTTATCDGAAPAEKTEPTKLY